MCCLLFCFFKLKTAYEMRISDWISDVCSSVLGYVQPYARFQYERLRFELRSGALSASIKIGEFTHFGKDMTLRIERSRDDGRQLSGIFVHANTKSGSSYSANAERGQFLATDDPDVLIFRLTNGTLVNDAPGYRTPRVLTFTSHALPINLPTIDTLRAH